MPVIKHTVLRLPLSYQAVVGVSPVLRALLLILCAAAEREGLSRTEVWCCVFSVSCQCD